MIGPILAILFFLIVMFYAIKKYRQLHTVYVYKNENGLCVSSSSPQDVHLMNVGFRRVN